MLNIHILSGLCLAVGLDLLHTVSFPAPVYHPTPGSASSKVSFHLPPNPHRKAVFFHSALQCANSLTNIGSVN